MSKLEVTKSIEARKLNPRSRLPLSEPPVTIPYGAILDQVVEKRDLVEFEYLKEVYQCKAEVLQAASHRLDSDMPSVTRAHDDGAAVPAAAKPFTWERLSSGPIPLSRARIPGGWLIASGDGVTFYPDPGHDWDGKTV